MQAACLIILLGATPLLGQTTVYWDTNGSASGAGGATPTGTWRTSVANWGNSAGTATTSNWTDGDIAVFTAGNNTQGSGSFTVTLVGGPDADSVQILRGDITFAGNSLTLTNTTNPSIDVASGATATFDTTKLLGSYGLVKDGDGRLILNHTGNNYSGATIVNAGTLQVGLSGGGNNILPSGTDLVINSGGAVEYFSNTGTQTVNSLSGAGDLDFGDNIFRISDSGNTEFSGTIADNGGTLRMQGSGTLTLSGNNTFSGALNVNSGVVVLTNDNALGAATSGNNIANGGALHFSSGIAVTETDLTIRGTGDGNGALHSLDGTNSLDAAITLATGSTITTDTGSTFTLSGGISRTNQNLTIDGAGDTVLSGVIDGTGAAQLIKNGTGTLELSGANTYGGDTTVNAGSLLALDDAALGAASAATNINSGSTLSVGGGITVTKTTGTLSLAGTGASGQLGALVAGGSTGQTSQWTGDITLTGNTTIGAADNLLIIGDDYNFDNKITLGSNTLTLDTTSATGVTPTYASYPAYVLDPSNLYISSTITGTGGVTKTGAGTANLI
ncbi:MAG: autotransporter-associated beta strand repeat-containing protein, partial [Opitutaceae bacterium]|nr:autotransporter-associated beta strand repeat-containing protein [Opitutaceae bacterium]